MRWLNKNLWDTKVLKRDTRYRKLTIHPGGKVITNGYRLYITKELIISPRASVEMGREGQ